MTEWKRLQELDSVLGRNQYGFVANVLNPTTDPVTVVGGQPVRWQGDVYDITPWRVYLGPWRRKQGQAITDEDDTIADDFAFPVPFAGRSEVAMTPDLVLYGRVSWGSGGVQHSAWVDWPVAGLLCQASGSYLAVDVIALVTTGDVDAIDVTKLPDLAATLSLEPGGGDSARSATYTYPFQSLDWTAHTGINFPVPPFARSVYFQWDNSQGAGNPNYAESVTIRFCRPDVDPVTGGEGVYFYTFASGDIGDPREGIPIPAGTAYVRLEPTFEAEPGVFSVGASFELDL